MLLAKSLLTLNPGVADVGIFDTFKKVVDTGEPDQSIRHYVHEQFNGWFHQSTVKLGDGVTTTTRDITEQKKAEQETREQKDLLRSVLSNTTSSIMLLQPVKDKQGDIVDFEYVYTNDQLLHSVRRNAASTGLTGKRMTEEFPGVKSGELLQHYIDVANGNGDWSGETHVNYNGFDTRAQVYATKLNGALLVTYFDITERKKAEQDLAKSKNLVQTVFDVSMNPIAYHKAVRDESGTIVDFEFQLANREASKYSTDNRVGKLYTEAYPGIRDTGIFDMYRNVVEIGHPLDTEVHVNIKGTERWMHIMAVKLDDGLVATAMDVTERKKAEHEIKESKELLESILYTLPKGLTVFEAVRDEYGQVVDLRYMLRNGYKIKGDEVDHLKGRLQTEAHPGTVSAGIHEKLKQVVQRGENTDFEVHYQNEGMNAWLRVIATKFRDGVIAFTEDITDRKNAQEEILQLKDEIAQRAEDKYRLLFNSIDEGFVIQELIYDAAGKPIDVRLEEANPAHEKLTGLKNVVGKTSGELGITPELSWFERYDHVVKTGEPLRFENWHDPTQGWYDVYISKIGGAESTKMAVVFNNITERKQNEEALRESEARLAQDLADAKQLQQFSNDVIHLHELGKIYDRLQQTAMELMRSDFASIQLYAAETETLILVGEKNFHPASAEFWNVVSAGSGSVCGEALREQSRIVVKDIETEDFAKGELEIFRLSGIRAVQSTPIKSSNGKLIGMLNTQWKQPRNFGEDDFHFFDVFVRQVADIIERKQAEDALRESEEKYRTLFQNIDEGFAILELIRDERGQIIDFIYKEVNEAFYRHTGRSDDFVGKKRSELGPKTEPSFMAALQSVIDTGEPFRGENFSVQFNRWVTFQYSLVGEKGSAFVAAMFNDITERKLHELQKEFLLKLSDALRSLTDATEIEYTACRLLGEELKVDRAYYCEVNEAEGYFKVPQDYHGNNVTSVAGIHPISAFAWAMPLYYKDEPVIIPDIYTCDLIPPADIPSMEALQVISFCLIPLIRNNTLVGTLTLTQSVPRKWNEHEVALLAETAERIWATAERAKAEEALRRADERYRAMMDNVPVLIWETDESGLISCNRHYTDFFGVSFEEVRGMGWANFLHPHDIKGYIATYQKAIERRDSYSYECRLCRADGEYRWTLNTGHPRSEKGFVGFSVDITENKRAEEALRKSEEKYRTLFETIDEGFCIIDMINTDGDADFRYVEVNQAWGQLTGLENVVGKLGSEVIPNTEDAWLDNFVKVAQTGEALRLENYHDDTRRWYSAHVSRIGGEGSKRVAIVFDDITERKQREQYQQFLIKFSDVLRAEPDTDAIANRAIRMLAEHLRLDRCYVGIALFDDNRGIFPYQFGNNRVAPMPEGGVSLSDFPDALRKTFDETLVITDFQNTEGLTETEKQNFAALGFGALVVANVRAEEHKPHWSINAVSAKPRSWTPIEVQLVEEATERTWAAMERARAEEALRQSEAKFRRLSEANIVGIAFFGVDGTITEANDEFLRFLGVTRDELRSDKVRWDVYTLEEWMPRTREAIEQLKATGVITPYEKQIRHADGTLRWGIFAGAMLADGRSGISMIVDITEEKATEEALRKSEAHLSAVFDALPIGISVVDAQGKNLLFNETMQRFLPEGIIPSRDANVGMRWKAYDVNGALVGPGNYPGARALRGETVVPGMECLFRQDDGTEIWVLVSAVPIRDKDSRIVEVLVLITDINDLKRTSEALREREAQLKRLLKLRDEFIGIASHELKTPVTSMKAYAEIVQERLEEIGNESDSHLVSRLNVQIDRLTALINALLDTTRISEGQLRLDFEEIDLNELLKDRIEEIQRTTNHKFILQTEDVPAIGADRERIGQVVINLLSNAIKYSPKGTTITVSIQKEQSGVTINVQDEGFGIPEADVTQIFDRFYRVTANNMDTYPGMGLGLYITAQIIRKHKGTISVQSKEGEGSIFSFTLPYNI